MRWSDVDFKPSSRKLRQFAATTLVFCSAIAAMEGFAHGRWTVAGMVLAVGLVLGMIGLVRPAALQPLFVGAMVACFPIGWCLSQVLLLAMFYGVFLPCGLLLRLTGRDALALRRPRGQLTYWSVKPLVADPRHYFRQF